MWVSVGDGGVGGAVGDITLSEWKKLVWFIQISVCCYIIISSIH